MFLLIGHEGSFLRDNEETVQRKAVDLEAGVVLVAETAEHEMGHPRVAFKVDVPLIRRDEHQ